MVGVVGWLVVGWCGSVVVRGCGSWLWFVVVVRGCVP